MRSLLFAAAALLVAGCQASPPADDSGPASSPEAAITAAPATLPADLQGEPFGDALTLTEITPVSTILDAPEEWIGKRVLVEGMIVAVCEKRGCWMDIASDREFEKIQIKVDDGVIVFPLSAQGKHAYVEGTVERLDLTAEEARAEAVRKAEEHGEAFDSTAVFGPETIYRIRGLGAVITD